MFKTFKEKHAYKAGIKKGRAGGKVWDSSPIYKDKSSRNSASSCKKTINHSYHKKSSSIKGGAYNSRGRVDDYRVDDRHGPVVFIEDDF